MIKDIYPVFYGDNSVEKIYRKELSIQIIDKYGKNDYTEEQILEILNFCLEYFINKFEKICYDEKSVRFYQQVFLLHEDATELTYNFISTNSSDIDFIYIAKYRRILKFIIEIGGDVDMNDLEDFNSKFLFRRFQIKLNHLLYLGEMILCMVDLYAVQDMMKGKSIDIDFDEEGLYIFSRKKYYDDIFQYMNNEFGGRLKKSIVDTSELSGLTDLGNAIKESFNIDIENVKLLIASIHEENKNKGGNIVLFEWENLPNNMHKLFGNDKENAKCFFEGLTLSKKNKMSLLNLASKPYKIDRYLYRPIITWSINRKDYVIIGKAAWAEALIQLSTNAIPWGKAPEEWLGNSSFKKYVNKKEDEHDKWLEDEVENKLIKNNIMYDRNLKSIHNTNINIEGLGEIDFIIISEFTKRIYIVDCKHLLGRYDIPNQRNDFNAFTSSKKPYNDTLERKVKWFKENKNLIYDHFKRKYSNLNINIESFDIEGIFIINTPTFYMLFSKFKIYDISKIEDVFLGKYDELKFSV